MCLMPVRSQSLPFVVHKQGRFGQREQCNGMESRGVLDLPKSDVGGVLGINLNNLNLNLNESN